MILREFLDKDYKIHGREHLDEYLVKLCKLVLRRQHRDPEQYGIVGACVLDPDHRITVGTTTKENGKWKHAEHNAMDDYNKRYGEIPEGSIIITTLSPCNDTMADRSGPSCTDIINASPVRKVYCGYMDPSQHDPHAEFTLEDTQNDDINRLCKKMAWTFLGTKNHPVEDASEVFENYQTTTAKFIAAGIPQDEINKTINQYRNLVNRNQVQGNERNIDWWAKQGWDKFNKFVQASASVPSTTQIKRRKVPGNSITLLDNNDWQIVVPLDRNASAYFGKNAQWCTTNTCLNTGGFEDHFGGQVLIYAISKSQDEEQWNSTNWAIVDDIHYYPKIYFELWNSDNFDGDPPSAFKKDVGLTAIQVIKMARQKHNKQIIDKARKAHQSIYDRISNYFSEEPVKRDPQVEQDLIVTRHPDEASRYIKHVVDALGPQDFPDQLVKLAQLNRKFSARHVGPDQMSKYAKNAIEK